MTREFYNKYKEYVKDITQEDINESFIINFMKDLYNFDLKPYLSGKIKLTTRAFKASLGYDNFRTLSQIFSNWETSFNKDHNDDDIFTIYNTGKLIIPKDLIVLINNQITFIDSKRLFDSNHITFAILGACHLQLSDNDDELWYGKKNREKHSINPRIRLKTLLELPSEFIVENLLIYSDE